MVVMNVKEVETMRIEEEKRPILWVQVGIALLVSKDGW